MKKTILETSTSNMVLWLNVFIDEIINNGFKPHVDVLINGRDVISLKGFVVEVVSGNTPFGVYIITDEEINSGVNTDDPEKLKNYDKILENAIKKGYKLLKKQTDESLEIINDALKRKND